MATRIRKRVCSTLLLFSWLFLLPGVAVGEPIPPGDVAGPGPVRAMSVPDGEELPGPATVRSWRYTDADELPWCLECPAGSWVTLISKAFVTNPTTSYVELDWTGQFTVVSTNPALEGLQFRAGLVQGLEVANFPGAGDDDNPFMARCDSSGWGPQWYGGYHGMLLVEPNTYTTLVIQLRSTAQNSYACLQNVTVRYD